MNASHIVLDSLPSLCQKVSDLVKVWHGHNKKIFYFTFACFFETRYKTVKFFKEITSRNARKNDAIQTGKVFKYQIISQPKYTSSWWNVRALGTLGYSKSSKWRPPIFTQQRRRLRH